MTPPGSTLPPPSLHEVLVLVRFKLRRGSRFVSRVSVEARCSSLPESSAPKMSMRALAALKSGRPWVMQMHPSPAPARSAHGLQAAGERQGPRGAPRTPRARGPRQLSPRARRRRAAAEVRRCRLLRTSSALRMRRESWPSPMRCLARAGPRRPKRSPLPSRQLSTAVNTTRPKTRSHVVACIHPGVPPGCAAKTGPCLPSPVGWPARALLRARGPR